MSVKRILATLGIVTGVIAAGVVGVAMYLVDQDAINLDLDYCGINARNVAQTTPTANGMELRGHWNGMALAGLGSRSAAQLGLAGVQDGVAVIEIDTNNGRLAQQAGIQIGDVIVGVDGQAVTNLVDLRKASASLPPATPVLVDVVRNGSVTTLLLPQQSVQPAIGVHVMAGPQFVCPRDGTLVPAAQLSSTGGTCPLCQGPLHLAGSTAAAVQ